MKPKRLEKVTSENGIVSIKISNIELDYMNISIEKGENPHSFLGRYYYRCKKNDMKIEETFMVSLKDLLGYLSLIEYLSDDHRSIARRVPKETFSNLSVFDDYLQFRPVDDQLMIENLTRMISLKESYRLNLVDDNCNCIPYFVLTLSSEFSSKIHKEHRIVVSEYSSIKFSYYALELLPSFWFLMNYCKKNSPFRISKVDTICQLYNIFQCRVENGRINSDPSEDLHLVNAIYMIDKFTSEWGWDMLRMAFTEN